MNRYVGTAKIRPDSRTPSRFPYAIIHTNSSESTIRSGTASGTTELIAWTPAAVETLTVRT